MMLVTWLEDNRVFFYTATTHGLHKNAGDLWIFTEIYVKMNSLEHFQQVQL